MSNSQDSQNSGVTGSTGAPASPPSFWDRIKTLFWKHFSIPIVLGSAVLAILASVFENMAMGPLESNELLALMVMNAVFFILVISLVVALIKRVKVKEQIENYPDSSIYIVSPEESEHDKK